MAAILNSDYTPSTQEISSFRKGSYRKTIISAGELVYRIVTKKDEKNSIAGNNIVEGRYWIDDETFRELSSRVDYECFLRTLTNIMRNALALTTDFSQLADSFICAELKEDVYAFKGRAARQAEYTKNGIRIIYPGNVNQLLLPNLTPKTVRLKFFHSI